MKTYSNVSSLEAATQAKPISLLMADDDPHEHLLVTMAAQMLELPMTIGFVPDGSDLLFALAEAHDVDELPDAIVLDLRMPGFDGVRTLEELGKHDVFKQIPVVVFTSSTRLEDEYACYESGAMSFETKPSTFSGMETFLKKVMTFVASGNGFERDDELNAVLKLVSPDFASDLEDELLVEEIDLSDDPS